MSEYYLQHTLNLKPEDIKPKKYELKDSIELRIFTNKKYAIVESEIPLDFVFEYKKKKKSYVGLFKGEIDSLVSVILEEKNAWSLKLKNILSKHIKIKKI